jgi:hypothetical protein
MTAKEKAFDLFRDMEFEIPYIQDPTSPQGDYIAKKCALIAVDELIKETGSKYWYDVKQEIEKL